jgi:hypothetical protein
MSSTSSVATIRFVFRAANLDPARVSEIMGLQPASSHAKGELSSRTKTPFPWGVWAVEFTGAEVEAAALRLLEILAGKKDAIAQVVSQMSATPSVNIWWEPEGGQGGYTISSETIRKLADLCERIDFSFV